MLIFVKVSLKMRFFDPYSTARGAGPYHGYGSGVHTLPIPIVERRRSRLAEEYGAKNLIFQQKCGPLLLLLLAAACWLLTEPGF